MFSIYPPESLVKMDHFQKEPPRNLKGTTGAQGGCRKGPVPKGTEIPLRLNVRFGSKADMCSALGDVRLVPKADMPRFIRAICRRAELDRLEPRAQSPSRP